MGLTARCALIITLGLTLPVTASPLSAQFRGTSRAAPERSYEASWIHRVFLGSLNRDLWTREVETPLLDLATFAGGLTPLRRGGGMQTRSLRLQGADGQIYSFRSLDKDASRNLDPQLRQSIAAAVLQDQIAARFPLSAMVVAPLLEAANVLHAEPTLVIMPSDPALGEFQADFGGLLGWIEVRPDEGPDGEPGFAGSSQVVGSDAFRRHLEESPLERINSLGFLRARLMDLFVGDWDRHPDQWRWAAFKQEDGGNLWEPIPRDRDWALSRIDGFIFRTARPLMPHYVGFGKEYESVFGTMWNGRALDRDLLSSLDRSQWMTVASDLQARLSDEVIEAAVRTLPAEYQATEGTRLRESLLNRRDGLMTAAMTFYGILSGWVDIRTTDVDESARVVREASGHVTVEVTAAGASIPHYSRRFDPAETQEIRLYMRGGEDVVRVEGSGPAQIRVRVIGGGGDDSFEDLTGGGSVHFYDGRGDNDFTRAGAAAVDESRFREPEDTESATHQARPRDWGSRWYKFPILGANSDIGLSLGQTSWRDTYKFRNFPYHTRFTSTLTLNPVEFGLQVGLGYDFPLVGKTRGLVGFKGSTRDYHHYFGRGNETVDTDTDRFRADRSSIGVSVSIAPRLPKRFSLRFGPTLQISTDVSEEGRFVDLERPVGFGNFTILGAEGVVRWDGRDEPNAPQSGGFIEIGGRIRPAIADVEDTYGGIHGTATFSVAMGPPVLSLKVSGEKVWGPYPYFEGAVLGGATGLRGYTEGRFVGDASVLGSAQLRMPLTDFYWLLPGTLGVHTTINTGRVYLEGETSDTWHTAVGGGLWASITDPKYTIAVTFMRGDDGNGLYFGMGFGY